MKNKLLIFTTLLMMCLVLVGTEIQVQAEETTYTYNLAYGYYENALSNTEYVGYNYSVTSKYPIYCVQGPTENNGVKEYNNYYLVILDDALSYDVLTCTFNATGYTYSLPRGSTSFGSYGIGNQSWTVLKTDYGLSQLEAGKYIGSSIVASGISGVSDNLKEIPGVELLTWTIPIFDSPQSLAAYIKTGDDSGQINKPQEPTLVYDDEFSLTGFTCSNSIYASWTGITNGTATTLSWDDVTVKVKPIYYLILEAGEVEQDYETLGTVEVPYTDYYYSKNYSDYFEGNPYVGRCQLLLYFTPYRFSEDTNEIVQGKSILVKFDENGNITNLDIPESSITPTFNSGLEFRNFKATNEFHNWGDSYVHCYWTGVNVDSSINYIYSDVKIQLFASPANVVDNNSHEWIEYDHDDIISFNTNKLSFNLSELDAYCKSIGYRFHMKNYDGKYNGEKIRLTPYCKTSNEYFYGKSVEITLGPAGGIDAVMQSTGDAIGNDVTDYTDLESDYISDGAFIEDVMDDIFSEDDEALDLNGIATDFFQGISSFLKLCGQFPALVTNVLGFLPEYYRTMLVIALGAVIILRVLGR